MNATTAGPFAAGSRKAGYRRLRFAPREVDGRQAVEWGFAEFSPTLGALGEED